MIENVSLDQLRVFTTIAEQRSFSAAARHLRRAQSAISHAIASLETALGVSLFDRSGRIPVLTEAGRVLLQDASTVLLAVDEMKNRAGSVKEKIEASLSIAVDVFMPREIMIAALKKLETQFPYLQITLLSETLGGVEEQIVAGRCDLGIVCTLVAQKSDSLDRQYLSKIELIPVAAAGHPLAQQKKWLSRVELQAHRQLVLGDRGLPSEHTGGVTSAHIWRFVDLDTRLAFLRAGFGWCFMPLHMVSQDLSKGRLKRLRIKEDGDVPFYAPLAISQRRGQSLGKARTALIEQLKAALGE